MIELLALAVIAVLALLYQDHRHKEQITQILRASESEAEAHRVERDRLCQRIQAPETVPPPDTESGPLYVGPDDWKGYWEQKEAMNGDT